MKGKASEAAKSGSVLHLKRDGTLGTEVPTTMTGFESWIREEPGLESTSLPAPGPLKVMSYNIRHGRGMDDVIDLQRLADVIAHSGAQIVGLNEVDIKTERSGGVDQPGTLGELLSMHIVYGPNITYQGGLYGNALLSKYPVVASQNISLPAGGRARWGLLHAELDVNGQLTHVLVTHLSLEPPERLEQLQNIMKVIRQLEGPVILMGDLNIVAGSDEDPSRVLSPLLSDAWTQMLSLLGAVGASQPTGYTFRSDSPSRRIDYVFINEQLVVAGENAVHTIDTQASDHLPLVVELQVRE